MTAAELVGRLKGVRGSGPWSALCPAHDDGRPSLSIEQKEDKVVLHCHAGCPPENIVAALGLTMADLFTDAGTTRNGSRIIAEYSYTDEQGRELFQVVRFEPKDFRQRHRGSGNEWDWRLNGVRRVPYHLPRLVEAVTAGRGVFIVEGEKDVHSLESLGLVATTAPSGAGKWREEYAKHFRGTAVYILPDNDEPGRKHADQVARALHGVAKDIRVVALPGLEAKGDVTDWLSAGGTADRLRELTKLAPPWYPPAAASSGTNGKARPDSSRRTTRLVVVRLSDVEAERVSWLAPGILPFGKVALIEGDPGVNKSTLALWIAARVTRGAPLWGSAAGEPRNVVIVSYEDGLADTVRPRIDALGGDATRVYALRAILDEESGDESLVTLPDNVPELRQVVCEQRAALVIVDPLGAGLSERVDAHKDAAVRRVTAQLAKFAEETGACVVGIRHLIKGEAKNAIRAGGGSIAMIAAARVAMLVSLHPDDAEKPQHERRRVFACVKNNLAPHPSSQAFELRQVDGQEQPSLRWLGECPLSADDLHAASAASAPEERAVAAERETWLRESLGDGPVEAKTVYRLGREAGYSDKGIDRAARKIGVNRVRRGLGTDHRVIWELPISSTPSTLDTPDGLRGLSPVSRVEGGGNTNGSQSTTEQLKTVRLAGILR